MGVTGLERVEKRRENQDFCLSGERSGERGEHGTKTHCPITDEIIQLIAQLSTDERQELLNMMSEVVGKSSLAIMPKNP